MAKTGHFNGLDWQHEQTITQDSDDAIITSWNPGTGHLYGYTAAEGIGRPMWMLLFDNQVPEEVQLLARIKAVERLSNFETVHRCKAGARKATL